MEIQVRRLALKISGLENYSNKTNNIDKPIMSKSLWVLFYTEINRYCILLTN